jgi:hypothetical protein
MFESFSSVDSSRTTPTEWLLARIAGREQAAAIMGDLEELSATRSKSWFWIAYARTLVSLGWRTPVAFLIAMASMRLIFRIIFSWRINHRSPTLMETGLFGVYNPHVRLITWNISMVVAQSLIFAVPFVLVRFGWRNRLSQLTCALFLIAMPIYSLRTWLMDLTGVLMMIAVVSALITPLWRKPMIVLAATCVTATAAVASCVYILWSIYRWHYHALSIFSCEAIGLALAAIVCVYLHRWLLERPPASDRTLA